MIKGLISLAFGALSFGIVEFVAMGLLPYFAEDFGVSIAEAGHTISLYALGVVAGAGFMVFCRRFNLKILMLCIVGIHLLGSILTAIAPSFELLLICRFISGLPHGCFFGVGAIIAQRLAAVGKSNSAMAIMIAGQTVSNVFGVPLGTALAHALSWQVIFYIMVVWGLIVLLSMIFYLPDTGKLEECSFFDQFCFLKHRAPHLIFITILFGNGGIFCVHSFLSPMITEHLGFELSLVPAVLIAIGFTMVIFNLVSGKLADRFGCGRAILYFLILGILSMLILAFVGSYVPYLGILCMCLMSGVLFGVGTPEQVAIVRTAKGGELLGVALGQVCFNFGNAMGAYLGGIPLDNGLPVMSLPVIGVLFVIAGAISILLFVRLDEKAYQRPMRS